MVLAPWLLGWPEPGLTFDTISTPTDVPSGMVVAACTVAEVLAGWVGVPTEALFDIRDPGND